MNLCAQVGINTSNPQGVFNIDGAKDNPATGTPNASQQANDVAVTTAGNMGIGLTAPTNKLHVNGTNPLRLQGLTAGAMSTDLLTVADANGVLKTVGTLNSLSIPTAAIFRLANSQANFLNGIAEGSSSVVPMSMIKNSIEGMSYDAATSTITFPAGTYQMTFVYEATHNATGCTISSYLVDFPLNASTVRTVNTAEHNQGGTSNHGGAIAYSTAVPANTTWQIRLGRGPSGNCSGAGMDLKNTSTQLLVLRIGN
ncbi:hypothetical protein [Chryseobacterium pennipullorum]|nr:hypothetical protein [Chryseobacterium pennipullorum]